MSQVNDFISYNSSLTAKFSESWVRSGGIVFESGFRFKLYSVVVIAKDDPQEQDFLTFGLLPQPDINNVST